MRRSIQLVSSVALLLIGPAVVPLLRGVLAPMTLCRLARRHAPH